MKKLLGIICCAVALSVVIIFGIQYREHRATNVFNDVYDAWSVGDYDLALNLSSSLPEPWDEMYTRFISGRIELDTWSGSAKELYQWMDTFFEEMNFENMPYQHYGDAQCIWKGSAITEQYTFEKDKKWIANAVIWMPELYGIQANYLMGYFNLLLSNRALLAAESSGPLIIAVDDMLSLDQEMETLYVSTIHEIDNLQKGYDDREIADLATLAEKCRNTYYENFSLYTYCSPEKSTTAIQISEDYAHKLLEKMEQLIVLEREVLSINATLDGLDYALTGLPEEFSEYCAPTRMMLEAIYRIYGDLGIVVTDTHYISIVDMIDSILPEELKDLE